jgi:hypothetical protein
MRPRPATPASNPSAYDWVMTALPWTPPLASVAVMVHVPAVEDAV